MTRRLLIVDNEVDILTAWETALRKGGYLVRTASSAKRALELCDEENFDIVILDYIMPRMKGLELLARIRKTTPRVRSILISGKLDKNLDAREIRESIRGEVETDRYLHKPISNEELLNVVSEVLKEAPQDRAWEDIASDHLESQKGSVSKAKGAQAKLKKHIQKG